VCTETFQGKPTFYVAYVKNEKKLVQNKPFFNEFLVFFVQAKKNICFERNLA
jgi:hypothetical protein